MLYEFLQNNQKDILTMTGHKTLELAGTRPTSAQLKLGLPIFFDQLIDVLSNQTVANNFLEKSNNVESQLAESASKHGVELFQLGYTLSLVVLAYGSMCQAITELASIKKIDISASEFHDLNHCLDIAIAGAVTGFEFDRAKKENSREIEHLGFLAHELRNALTSVKISFQLIKKGTVDRSGNTAQVIDRGLKRIEELIDRSLTEVRLRMDPIIHRESGYLIQLVDQIVVTAAEEAREKNQTLKLEIDPTIIIKADQQLFYSAISNLIQNAIKFSKVGGVIKIRGKLLEKNIIVEVEDECGGLLTNDTAELFLPFEQQNKNKSGLGLGLTIAQKAINLNHGQIRALNLPGKGCLFTITLPNE